MTEQVAVDHLPALDWPRVGLMPVVRAIEAALAQGSGFSLIRLGDGEGAMLAHAAAHMVDEVAFSLSVWFGAQEVAPIERSVIAARLRDAIRGATVLGLPRRRQLQISMRYHEVFWAVDGLVGGAVDRAGPMVCDMAIHFYLQWSGALGRILRQARRVTLIGCRDVAADISRAFGCEVQSWPVRGEAAFPGVVETPHWPEGFYRMRGRIEQLGAGDLLLVGAGVLGKFYCEAARRRGAVALDLGSVFDGWQAVPSRGERTVARAENRIDWLAGCAQDEASIMARLTAAVEGTNITDGTL